MSNPTAQLVVKMIVSGVFVGLISELAKRLPRIGGLVAALPIISLLTVFWLLVDRQTNAQIAHFVHGVLFGLIPTGLGLLLLALLLERDVSFAVALVISLLALAAAWIVVRAVVA